MGDMEEIRKHFEEEAAVFDSTIVRIIPYYREMIDILVSSLPFGNDESFSVLDLGCGTGTVSARILGRFPNASVTCLDIAENMLEMARLKLGGILDAESRRETKGSAEFVSADFASWTCGKKYDAVVSSLALHHLLDDESKKAFFGKAAAMLVSGGAFRNADVVLSADAGFQAMYLAKWREFMLRSVPAEEIDSVWFPSYERQDRPAVLMDQCRWLSDAGFDAVDILWKYCNFAVYGGKKR